MLHFRGDTGGMFIFFVLLFLGLIQLIVAWKRLNGLSLTGYPDRRAASLSLGLVMTAGSCAWYFSRPGHFAAPDVEGVESMLLLVLGLTGAVLIQALLSSLLFRKNVRPGAASREAARVHGGRPVTGEGGLKAHYYEADRSGGEGAPVLLIHDYADDRSSLSPLAVFLSSNGHPCLAFDLDGHGENPRGVTSPLMEDVIDRAVVTLVEMSGREDVCAVGAGFGGTLCLAAAERDPRIVKAVAVDPPGTDGEGRPAVNAMRELKPPALLRAFLAPPVRGEGTGRVSLAALLERLNGPPSARKDRVLVIGTTKAWFNSPEALSGYLHSLGADEPLLLEGSHSDIASRSETMQAILRNMGSGLRFPENRKFQT